MRGLRRRRHKYTKKMKEGVSKAVTKRLERFRETGVWLMVMPNRLNGTARQPAHQTWHTASGTMLPL